MKAVATKMVKTSKTFIEGDHLVYREKLRVHLLRKRQVKTTVAFRTKTSYVKPLRPFGKDSDSFCWITFFKEVETCFLAQSISMQESSFLTRFMAFDSSSSVRVRHLRCGVEKPTGGMVDYPSPLTAGCLSRLLSCS
jgi:hypothetical protein